MKNKASSSKVRTAVQQSCETQRETGIYKTLYKIQGLKHYVLRKSSDATNHHRIDRSHKQQSGKFGCVWIRPGVRPTHTRHADYSYTAGQSRSPALHLRRVYHWRQTYNKSSIAKWVMRRTAL